MQRIDANLHWTRRLATISKLPSGKFRGQVRRGSIYKARTFDRKAEATQWAAAMEAAVAGGSSADVIAAPKAMTLGAVIAVYSEAVPTGRTTKANLIRIDKMIGSTRLAQLNAIVLRDFVPQWQAEGAGGVTLASDLSALSGVLKWARRVQRLDVNDKLAAEARSGLTAARISTRSKERTRLPAQAELAQIIAHLDRNPRMKLPVSTITRFAAISAMQLSEITGLRIEDMCCVR